MSLLDGGMHADHPSVIIDSDAMFQEEIFGSGYTLRGRAARNRAGLCHCMSNITGFLLATINK